MDSGGLVVLKFGSSVFADSQSVPVAVSEISRHIQRGEKVVAVVSALAGETDRLFQMILELDPAADDRHVADFVSTGERQSTILLTVALGRIGVRAQAVEPQDIGLSADGAILDSDPIGLDCEAFASRLSSTDVIVVPGYVARNNNGQNVLLGRGGSDDTALFLASELGARCRLIKDVDGIFEWDPAVKEPAPRRFSRIRWADALSVANELVQQKAIRFAEKQSMSFEVAALGSDYGSEVGPGPTTLEDNAGPELEFKNQLVNYAV